MTAVQRHADDEPARVPFVRGSDTSRAAARSQTVARLVGNECLVFDAIRAMSDGVTDDTIEVATGLSHQSASARRNGLVRKGLVCDSGRRARTRSGRLAVLWIVGEGTPIEGAALDRVPRPTNAEIVLAAGYISDACASMPDALMKLRRWLLHIAR